MYSHTTRCSAGKGQYEDGPGGRVCRKNKNVSGACISGEQPNPYFMNEIYRNGLETSSMFQGTACKEENPGVFPSFADALQEHGRGGETTQSEQVNLPNQL
jgi:hypothetical protein